MRAFSSHVFTGIVASLITAVIMFVLNQPVVAYSYRIVANHGLFSAINPSPISISLFELETQIESSSELDVEFIARYWPRSENISSKKFYDPGENITVYNFKDVSPEVSFNFNEQFEIRFISQGPSGSVIREVFTNINAYSLSPAWAIRFSNPSQMGFALGLATFMLITVAMSILAILYVSIWNDVRAMKRKNDDAPSSEFN